MTGKTSALTRWIEQTAARHGHEELLVGSFTRAAAHELAGRDLPLDHEQIGTLHAHAYHALDYPPMVERRHLGDWNREHPSVTLSEGWTREEADDRGSGTNPGDALMARLEVARARRRDLTGDVELRWFAKEWTAWKAARGLCDFTDLIEQSLADAETAPCAPRIGFWDEAQDFTELELALVRKWGAAMEYTVLAGDDDQCVYGFKGANPDAFITPDIPVEHKRVLGQSYRLPHAVHAYAERWVAKLSHREPKPYAPRDVAGELRHRNCSVENGSRVVQVIEEALARYATVMVLTTCGYMLQHEQGILPTLRAAGLPYHNAYAPHRDQWNPLRRPKRSRAGKVQLPTAERLRAYLREPWTYADVATFAPLLEADGIFPRGCKHVVTRWSDGWTADPDELRSVITEQAYPQLQARRLDWLLAHATKEATRGLAYPVAVAQRYGEAALDAPPRLTLGTIHSVKGGEADCVLLFPNISRAGEAEQQTAAGRDALIRQMYVGMTRAREALWIGTGSYPQVELP